MAGWNTTDIDWTSAATIEPTLASQPYLVLHDIAEALRERSPAVASPPTILPSVQRGDPKGIVLAMDAMYELIYGKFTNHTDSSGLWNNSAAPAPVWTEGAMETATGLSRPAAPIKGDLLSSDWVFWMYSAINRLLWTRHVLNVYSGADYTEYYKVASNADWATAVSAFDASSWIAGSTFARPLHHAWWSSPKFWIFRTGHDLDDISAPTALDYKADMYMQFAVWMGDPDVYENNDFAVDQNNYYRVFNDASARSGTISSGTIIIGKITSNTLSEPAKTGDVYGWDGNLTNLVLLRKYDVTDGFDYR